MIARLLLSLAVSAACFGSVSSTHSSTPFTYPVIATTANPAPTPNRPWPTIANILNPGFEEVAQGLPAVANYPQPLYWEQDGSGDALHPTVRRSAREWHTGAYSAEFVPRSVTGISLGSPVVYRAEISQHIRLLERGQLLTMTWWMKIGGQPSVDLSAFGVYNFTVSYDHAHEGGVTPDHQLQLLRPVRIDAGRNESDPTPDPNHGFGQWMAQWYAPDHVEHISSSVNLVFTTTNSTLYMYLDDIHIDSPLIIGDPQFVGLRGQKYQVHGIDGAIYNLVTSPSTQVNAEFKFLSEGECPMFDGIPDTNCWAHPGSYLGSVGVQEIVGDVLHQVTLVSGPADSGFASVLVDGKEVSIGSTIDDTTAFSVSYASSHRVIVLTSQFMFTFDNSDKFINQGVSARVPMSSLHSHGLFGQTHQRKMYSTPLKYIAGEVDDYMIEESTLCGNTFVYNRFQQK